MLDMTRLDRDSEIEARPMDLNTCVAAVVDEYLPFAQDKQIALDYQPGQAALPGHADEERLRSALGALLRNAINFTPQEGNIVVRTESSASHHVI